MFYLVFSLFFFHLSSFVLSYCFFLLCRKQTNLWAQGDTLRSKQQKSRVYEESSVPRLISSIDDLTISSSFLRSGSMDEVGRSGSHFHAIFSVLINQISSYSLDFTQICLLCFLFQACSDVQNSANHT